MTRPSVAEGAAARRRANVRATSSDSDSRVKTDKSSSNPRKLGTRIADLESQLGLAQEELKCLKFQLASTDTAKKVADGQQMDNKLHQQEKVPTSICPQMLSEDNVHQETDVFEVAMDSKPELKLVDSIHEFPPDPELEPQNPLIHELESKNNEINLLKATVSDKDRELQVILGENESLKCQLNDKSHKLSSAQSELDDLTSKLNKVVQELEESKFSVSQIQDKLQAAEKAKTNLEGEMSKLRVQTEQWRKAADAAASVLAGEVESRGGRISERCGSMDTTSLFDRVGGFTSYVGSPRMHDDPDYAAAFGTEKQRKAGSGIKLLGELWRKKAQK